MPQYDDQKLESFLLDELSSPEREEIEQRIFTDDELYARVEDLETDLIDAYARNTIDKRVRARFEQSLETNPARQEKVRLARLLDERLFLSIRARNVLPFTRRYSRALRFALAATVLIALVAVPALLRKSPSQEPTGAPIASSLPSVSAETPSRVEATKTPTASATDSAETYEAPIYATKRSPVPTLSIKKPPVPDVAELSSVTFVLSTMNLRSGTGLNRLEIHDDVHVVIVQLAIESDEFPSYNVDIRNSKGQSIWSAARLPLGNIEGVPAVSFEVPAEKLDDGRHELVLAGVNESGTEEIAYVDFEVRHID